MNQTIKTDSSASRAKKLAAYSLAAGAATATGATADAQIVYSGPQNIAIGAGFSQNLNLDGDAFGDVTLLNNFIGVSPYQSATVNFFPGRLVGFTAGPSNFAYVSALSPGFLIGPSSVGPSFTGSMAFGASNPNAQSLITNLLVELVTSTRTHP
jgi:hypothetical protein